MLKTFLSKIYFSCPEAILCWLPIRSKHSNVNGNLHMRKLNR